jgi:Polyphosphate kinase 2 (PPK2)
MGPPARGFEGRDGAGKGGVIKAITARVSPREFRVVALPAATEREKSQMYIQRYLPHLPSGGAVVIFEDRPCGALSKAACHCLKANSIPMGCFRFRQRFADT